MIPGSPHDDGPSLPMATLGSKMRTETPVIRWMSGYMRPFIWGMPLQTSTGKYTVSEFEERGKSQ